MAQIGWIYLDNAGGRHRVGLYHGDRSGHLMIHCDLRVVQIDFSVKETRVYSFFVEDELCEVGVYKEKEGFTYDFKVNKEVDTPRNRVRRAEEKRNRGYMALMILGMAVFIGLAVSGLLWYNRQQDAKRRASLGVSSGITPELALRLTAEGRDTAASLFIIREARERKVLYTFTTADARQVTGKMSVADTGLILLPSGFPLSDRDAFTVRYLPANPQVNQLDFSRPTPRTLAGYAQMAAEAEARAHPEAEARRHDCMVRLTLREKGWQGLADLIFQNTPPEKNTAHNRDSYLRLMREPDFARKVQVECGPR